MFFKNVPHRRINHLACAEKKISKQKDPRSKGGSLLKREETFVKINFARGFRCTMTFLIVFYFSNIVKEK